MNSSTKSLLFAATKTAAFLLMLLPIKLDLWIGRSLGWCAYYFLSRKRKVVYANLKAVFAGQRSPEEIDRLARDVFINFLQSVVELLCLPKLARLGLDRYVELDGKENINEALSRGKGVVFLAIHSGSWELASVVGGISNGLYNVVVNNQSKIPQLDTMLNEYRTIAGAHVITRGVATRDIVTALHNNEIVSLVLDQGGRQGLLVPFFGKTASMSTGAIRLALKYGSAVCPVWIERKATSKHVLSVLPAMSLTQTGDMEKDVETNVIKAAAYFERALKEHPMEYLWFYKVFKYSSQRRIVIVDDGRTGHLRQSQAMARYLAEVLKKNGKSADVKTVSLEWRSPWALTLFSFYGFLAQYSSFLKKESRLKWFLTEASFRDVMQYKADYVISCGSQAAGVNLILSRNHLARSISILTPGMVSKDRFDVVVGLEHDRPRPVPGARLISLKVSPNLISPAYLKEQSEGLLRHYSHLKGNVRMKFGIMIGGDTAEVKFNESQINELMVQIKEAALHYNADILVTTSRRTPAGVEQAIAKALKGFERCALCIIANQNNIPEAVGGILALSDLVIVSGESISMVSEALASGKGTIVFSPRGRYGEKPRDKYEEFVLKLNDQGYLMVTSVDNMKAKIAQLLSRKITLKGLDDGAIIRGGLEAVV
jgi:KDO2-lipid IV(A) lauroyltransferase